MTRPGSNSRPSECKANTLPNRPLHRLLIFTCQYSEESRVKCLSQGHKIGDTQTDSNPQPLGHEAQMPPLRHTIAPLFSETYQENWAEREPRDRGTSRYQQWWPARQAVRKSSPTRCFLATPQGRSRSYSTAIELPGILNIPRTHSLGNSFLTRTCGTGVCM